jgi:hypothetical protein
MSKIIYLFSILSLGLALTAALAIVLAAPAEGAPSAAGQISKVSDSLAESANTLLTPTATNPPTVCVQPPSGLVSWWPGDGNADDIWDSNQGTLYNGATFAPGIVAEAFIFDGINDYVQATDLGFPYDDAPRTLEFWIKPAFDARVPAIYGDYAPNDAFYVLVQASNACIGRWGGGDVCGATDVTDGNWHHVAMTYNGAVTNNVRLFVDGQEEANEMRPYSTTSRGILTIGHSGVGPGDFYNGLVDEVSIYNGPLTASEIAAIYNAGSNGKCKFTPTPTPTDTPTVTVTPTTKQTPTPSATPTATATPIPNVELFLPLIIR